MLEAVASQDTWFWHAFFGPPGSNNVTPRKFQTHRGTLWAPNWAFAIREAWAGEFELSENHRDDLLPPSSSEETNKNRIWSSIGNRRSSLEKAIEEINQGPRFSSYNLDSSPSWNDPRPAQAPFRQSKPL
ncbi:hypothetical protein E3N88_37412 [Mikania micrantha]|uniref:Uncharacterized protein n=1 Tax=Mikania micrantha TaxID=192012 RepID=A0A5N6LS04_9ASTR|nr:hypothetical protein E3N88_37412 [Mikania micrantha]